MAAELIMFQDMEVAAVLLQRGVQRRISPIIISFSDLSFSLTGSQYREILKDDISILIDIGSANIQVFSSKCLMFSFFLCDLSEVNTGQIVEPDFAFLISFSLCPLTCKV